MAVETGHINIHGRRWGRGWRPYLLLPKIVFVGAALGGAVTLLALVFLQPVPNTLAGRLDEARLIRRTYVMVIVPALLGAMLTGATLLWMHGRVLLRMRWLQVKLVIVAICVPTLHFYMRSRSLAFKAMLSELQDFTRTNSAILAALRQQLFGGTLAVLAFLLTVLFLGRIKPRLGQNYARMLRKPNE